MTIEETCNVLEASCDTATLRWNVSPTLVVFFGFPDKLTTLVLNVQLLPPAAADGNRAALMQLSEIFREYKYKKSKLRSRKQSNEFVYSHKSKNE